MSASERLAALVGPVTGDDINRFLAALPEIVAVLREAEETVEYDPDYADVNDPNPLAAALAALEKVLAA